MADVFDSDFDETDDEAGGDEEEAGERELERQQAEARRVRLPFPFQNGTLILTLIGYNRPNEQKVLVQASETMPSLKP